MHELTDEELARLRERGHDLVRACEWNELLNMSGMFRRDFEYWTRFWAPQIAIAARHLGDESARGFLNEAIARGFSQPELFYDQMEELFGGESDWADLRAAMAANVPPPVFELLDWPAFSPAHPVRLDEVPPDHLDELRQRLPQRHPSAWDTAKSLLSWVALAWQHSGSSHVQLQDAVHVLERVEAGERFACVEYSIVLTQALNAYGIPARRVGLLAPNYHTGFGRGHVVTEAWIDELGRWVVLDGQNGMYWVDGDSNPLGLRELGRRNNAGEPAAEVESLAGKQSAVPERWWPYFHRARETGFMVVSAPFTPAFQDKHWLETDELRLDAAGSDPDLLELGIGVVKVDEAPAIQPLTRHPHATGFEVTLDGQRWRLPPSGQAWPVLAGRPGEYSATIATMTAYGAHCPRQLRYVFRPVVIAA
ncbi:MAG TPA: transglutaminase domain-containing protein [Candidatus Limnocylindrales bacterium]